MKKLLSSFLAAAALARAAAPTINTPPANALVTSGQSATFSVAASPGTAGDTLSYQWQRNGLAISGATGASYTVSGATRVNNGDLYAVVVTEQGGGTAAANAQLRVAPTSYPGFVAPDPAWTILAENGSCSALAFASIADGSLYVAGQFTNVNGTHQGGILHLTAAGALDPAFAPPVLDGIVNAVAVQSDGRILIGGTFTHVGGTARSYLARLNTNGSLDASYTPLVANGAVSAIALQANGQALIGGNFSSVSGFNRSDLARLNADGSLDLLFNSTNAISGGAVLAIAPLPSGQIVITGNFTSIGGTAAVRLARVSAAGALDATFHSTGAGLSSAGNALAVDGSGNILVGGSFATADGVSVGDVARYTSAGVLDPSFNSGGAGFNGSVFGLLVQGGNVLVAGSFSSFDGTASNSVVRLSSAGAIDGTFTPPATTSALRSLAFDANNHLFVGGFISTLGGASHPAFARLSANGVLDPTVSVPLRNGFNTITCGIPLAGGQVLLGGSFNWLRSSAVPANLARFNSDGSIDAAFNSGGLGANNTIFGVAAISDGRIAIGGAFTSFNGTTRNRLALLTPAGAIDPTFALASGGLSGSGNTVYAVAGVGSNQLLAAGSFTSASGTSVGNIARYNADGTLDVTFNPSGAGANGNIFVLAVQQDGRVVIGGSFSTYNGTACGNLARLNANGTLDTSFNVGGSGTNGSVYSLGLTPSGQIYAGGSFSNYDGTSRSNVLRLNADGTYDTTYVPSVSFNYGLVVQEDGKVVVHGPSLTPSSGGAALERLGVSGALDTAFAATQIGPNNSNEGLVLMRDNGQLLLAGSDQGLQGTLAAAPPAITAQPAAVAATLNSGATFTVAASGSGALAYQWYFNGSAISGATGSSFTIGSAQTANVGSYDVVVTSELGSVTSSVAALSGTDPAPAITVQPASLSVTAGASALFSVTATGSATLSYQWMRNGYPIAGATGTSYTIPSASRTDADYYSVVVWNGLTPLGSANAQLTVAPAAYPGMVAINPALNLRPEFVGGIIQAIAPTPSGAFYLGGYFTTVNGNRVTALFRVTAAGAVDPTFTAPDFDANVNALAVQADGRLVLGGSFQRINGIYRPFLARLNTDGSLDSSFQGSVTNTVNAIVQQTDGKMLVGGYFGTADGNSRNGIARLNADGTLDAAFAPSGGGTPVNAIAIQPNGAIVLGGGFTSFGSSAAGRIVRLTSTGAIDPTFAPGTGANSTVNVVVIDSSGNVILGGDLTQYNGTPVNRLVRVSSTGAYDSTFAPGTTFSSTVRAITAQGANFLVGGSFSPFLTRVTSTGSIDSTFSTLAAPSSAVYAVAFQPDGHLLVGGSFTSLSGNVVRDIFARYNSDLTTDAAANFATRSCGNNIGTIVPLPGGSQFLMGGAFSFIAGSPVPANLARVGLSGAVDGTFNPGGAGPNGTVYAGARLPDGRIVIGGGFGSYNGVARPKIALLKSDGTLDTSFAPASAVLAGTVYTVVPMPGGKIFVAGSFTVSGAAYANVALFRSDGSLDPAFTGATTGPSSTVDAAALQSNGRIVLAGTFATYNGTARSGLVRINPDGSLDPGFNAAGAGFSSSPTIDAVQVLASGQILAAGNFSTYNGASRSSVVRINADGTLDTTYSQNGLGVVYGLLGQEDGKVIAHAFATQGTPQQIDLFRFNASGALDSAFVPGGITPAGTNDGAMVMLDNGQMLFASQEYGIIETQPGGPPVILTQPAAQTAAAGATVTFQVTIGTPPPSPVSYQWTFNGLPIAGATSSSYTIASAQAANAGSYAVIIGSELGGLTSTAATLSGIATAPTITTQPSNVVGTVGSPVSLSVQASGAAGDTLTYQWYRDGFPIAGATAATFTLPSPAQSDTDTYNVVVADGLSATASNYARIGIQPAAYPGPVELDPSFDLPVELANSGTVWAIAQAGNGQYYIAGDFVRINGTVVRRLARMNPDGSRDATFNPAVNDSVRALAVLPNGQLLAGGLLSMVNGVTTQNIVRLNADGTLDPTFDAGLSGTNAFGNVLAIALQSDGRIVIGGNFTSYNGVSINNLARLNADGTLDASFNPGTNLNGQVDAVAIDSSGRIVAGGSFTSFGSTAVGRIVRVSATGGLDPAFNSGGAGFNGTVNALALDSAGNVVVGGSFGTFNTSTAAVDFARLTPAGAYDSSFNAGGAGFSGTVNAIAIDGSGNLLVGGSFSTYNGTPRNNLARLGGTGTLDGTLNPNITGGAVQAISLAADGSVYFGGAFTSASGQAVVSLTHFTAANAFDPAVVESFRSAGTVLRMVPLPAGQMLVGGNFNFLGTTAVNNLARLNSDQSVDTTFNGGGAGPSAQVNALGYLGSGQVLVGGNFTTYNGLSAPRIVRINADGSVDTSFNAGSGPSSPVTAIALVPGGGAYLAGAFGTYNGSSFPSLVRILPNGSLDTSFFAGSASFTINDLALQPDGKLLAGGSFTSVAGTAVNRLTRFTTTGTLDSTFGGAGANNTVQVLALQPDGSIFVGGNFTSYGGTSVNRYARALPTGLLDPAFAIGTGANSAVYGVLRQEDGKFLAYGAFGSLAGTPNTNYLGRIGAAGAVDSGFAASSYQHTDTINAAEPVPVRVLDNGQVLVGGGAGTLAGQERLGLIRLRALAAPTITSQPASQTAAAGASVTFSVTASAGLSAKYQWYLNGLPVAGGTSASLALSSVQPANSGTYVVVVTNAAGSVASTPVTLSGSGAAPVITAQPPATVLATVGTPASISVGATGTNLTYQWLRNGYPIAGATSATFSLASPSRTDADFYSVVVASGLSTTSSQVCQLSVQPAVSVTLVQPDPSWAIMPEYVGGQIYAFALAPDGSFYAAGFFTSAGGAAHSGVVHVLASGAVDPGFNAPVFDSIVASLALLPNGELLAGGYFFHVNGERARGLVRLNADGTWDTTFNPGINGNVYALAVQPDGKYVVGGSFGAANHSNLTRITADGLTDTSFVTSGINNNVNAIALTSGGGIVIGGAFTSVNATAVNFLAQLTSTGALDPSFASGTGLNNDVAALAIDPSGNVLVGGDFTSYNGNTAVRILRLSSTGAYDSAFAAANGTGANSTVRQIVLQGSNLLIGGNFATFAGTTVSSLCRLTGNGALDPSFVTVKPGAQINAIALTPDGHILIGGSFSQVGSAAQTSLARLTATGPLDPSLAVPFRTAGYNIAAIVPLPGGQVLVGGTFSYVRGNPVPADLARFNADGTFDATFNPGGSGANGTIYAAARLPDGRVAIGGSFTSYNGVSCNHLALLTPSGAIDPSFHSGTGLNGTVYTLTVLPGEQIFAGGAFSTANGNLASGVAVFNSDGTPALGFNAGTGVTGSLATVYCSALTANGELVVGGSFLNFNGLPAANLARIFPNGAADAGLATGTGANNTVYSLSVAPSGAITVAGAFTAFNGTNVVGLARISSSGMVDPSLYPVSLSGITSKFNVGSTFGELQLESGAVLVSGWFSGFAGTSGESASDFFGTSYLQRESAGGSLDPSFRQAGIGASSANFSSIVVRDNGQLFVAASGGGLVGTMAGTAPAIIQQPAPVTVAAGSPAAFSVTVSAGIPVTYQWYRAPGDGSPSSAIVGATGPSYGIPAAAAGDEGMYGVMITSEFGSFVSTTVPFIVTGPPVIASSGEPPATTTVSAGQTVSLSVTATVNPAGTYQWQVQAAGGSTWTNLSDGGQYSGSGTATLSIGGVSAANNGAQYRVVITNAAGSVTSSVSTLTTVPASPLYFSTLAGSPPYGSTDGTGSAARFNFPAAVAYDGAGNVYVADSLSDTIRKVTPAGVVTTVAGTPGISGSADGTAGAALFNSPNGIAMDGSGNLYIADFSNDTIRRLTPAGIVSTLAGSPGVAGSADGVGAAAQFNGPQGIALDSAGANLYIADSANDTIRELNLATRRVTTLAGVAGVSGSFDGLGAAAYFHTPQGVAVDGSGTVYVADYNNGTIRAISSAGMVTTLVGKAGSFGHVDGFAEAARLNFPVGVALDGQGNLWVADANTIRQVNLATATISTAVGSTLTSGSSDGTGNAASFASLQGIAFDGHGNLAVADGGNFSIRQVALTSGTVTTLAGAVREADGTGNAAAFESARAICSDPSGNLYVTDAIGETIRKVTAAGVVTTIAGTAGVPGSADGLGTQAQFFFPAGIARDAAGNLYVSDGSNQTIRMIAPSGAVTTIAGAVGQIGTADGPGLSARFDDPRGLALDGNGNLYIGDLLNHSIRKLVLSTGMVSTFAGTSGVSGTSDGTGTGARFIEPIGLAIDGTGNLYVADRTASNVRMITPAGVVTTVAGQTSVDGYADGPVATAVFNGVTGVAVDGAGNVFVSDDDNVIRRISGGVVTTVGGLAGTFAYADGLGAQARFYEPWGMTTDSAGNLYVCDLGNSAIRVGSIPPPVPVIVTAPAGGTVAAGGSTTLSVTATGATSYQWQFNGTPIFGATSASYTVNPLTAASAGSYTVVVGNVAGSVTSGPAVLSVITQDLIATSAQGQVSGGAEDLSSSFTIEGTSSKQVLLRAWGPALAARGVTGALADPVLTVTDQTGAVVATNNDWGSASSSPAVASATAAAGAAPFADGSKDAALVGTFAPGTYAVHVSGNGGTAGLAQLDIFDADAAPRLVYVSARSLVPTGSVGTLNFTVGGTGTHQFLVRALGQALGLRDGMGDLLLTVSQGSTPIATDLTWGSAASAPGLVAAAATAGVEPLADGSSDAAALVTVGPGNYSVAVNGAGGGMALLEVAEVDAQRAAAMPPAIVSNPEPQSIPANASAFVGAVVLGKPAPAVRWSRNGSALADAGSVSGSSTPRLVISNAQVGVDNGSYTLTATNGSGTVTSVPVSLGVGSTPNITQQPAAQSVTSGTPVTFSVTATGSPAPTYQWQFNNAPLSDGGGISGSATATLSIATAQPANQGIYTVLVTNAAGSLVSAGAALTVQAAPAIATQPASLSVVAGQPATFTVVATGTPPPTYQWYKGLTAIPGATGATFTIPSAATTDQAQYVVTATNLAGSVASAPATLTVNTVPVFSATPSPVSVLQGGSVTLTAAAGGSPAPTYQWSLNNAAIPGATSASYTITNAQAAAGGSYTVTATNAAGSVTSPGALVTVDVPAFISAAPAAVTVTAGQTATFSVIAGGSTPVTYQWFKNGVPLGGQTGATLTLNGVPYGSGGMITVTAANAFGHVTSTAVALTVNPVAPTLSGTTALLATQGRTFSYTPSLNGTAATFSLTAGTLPAGLSLDSVQGTIFGAPSAVGSASVTITASNASGTASLAVTITVQPPPPVITSPAAANGTTGSAFTYSTVASNTPTSFTATGLPTGLSISASGVISGTVSVAGTYVVTITAANATGSVSQTVTLTFAAPPNAPSYNGPTSVGATQGTAVNFAPQFANSPTGFVLTNLPGGSPSVLPAGLSFNAATGAVTGTPTQAGVFPIAVQATGAGGSATVQFTITVNPAATAPVIAATSAGNLTETVGTPFTFLVEGSGNPVSYGATGLPAPLGINGATGVISGTPAAPGTYPVLLTGTNAAGTGPTATLLLQVNPSAAAPVINSSPVIAGTALTAFSGIAITASNSPTGFAVTSGTMPPGLALDPGTGAITGTPSQAGQSTVWIAASNGGGGQGLSLGVLFNIAPAQTAPVITSVGSAYGQVGQPFTYQITATNAPTGYAAANLPAGLSLDPVAGVIAGTPTAATTQPVSVVLTATNAGGTGATKTLSLTIAPAPATPAITSPALASGQAGTAFSFAVTASNAPTSYAATGLPAGLSINPATGVISGTPTAAGSFTATVQAANAGGLGASAALVLAMAPAAAAPQVTNTSTSVSKTAGQSFTYAISASNGPITSYAVTGTLPSGLALNTATGVISGTPNEPGTTTVEISATNAVGSSAPQPLVISILAPAGVPVIISSQILAGTVGAPFTSTVKALYMPTTNPLPPYATIDAVDLPPGLAINPSTGMITGTPSANGTFVAYAQAVNAVGTGALTPLTFNIAAAPSAPVITSPASAAAQSGQPFSYTITAAGVPTSFDVAGVPSWMVVNTQTGVISGRPAAPGVQMVTLTATNAAGSSQPLPLSIAVAAAAGTPVVTTSQTATGTVNSPGFTYVPLASNAPTSWLLAPATIPAGSIAFAGLPSGLGFDPSTGTIAGKPLASGTYLVALSAVNGNGQGAAITLTITINPSLSFVTQ